ncbi:MAG: hypothetical protein CME62_08550 [Halobacteriovoraceae bacterium]|nr:hypothetical protein [Halobacteriovoraceae bacterium]|tara:strand:- start:3638 stop:3976 length:339 start_codon:yes stop_codon:yes gene_type:complete
MSLQQQVLKLYKENFPTSTLQSISDQTGIQITRVFRIFNGAEMKVTEYETFQRILGGEKFNAELIKVAGECLEKLTKERNAFIVAQLKHALKIQELKNTQSLHHPMHTTSIA